MLEFGEEMGCWGSDWGVERTVIISKNHIMAGNGNMHIQRESFETCILITLLNLFFESENNTHISFLLLKKCCRYHCHSCFCHADSTNNKQGKRGDEFHSHSGGVVTVSALSKCCSCCQMMPWLPSSSTLG